MSPSRIRLHVAAAGMLSRHSLAGCKQSCKLLIMIFSEITGDFSEIAGDPAISEQSVKKIKILA